ncbi:hypothetical protein BJ508DRAFT_418469, partial [Ascobolus immersus RN42]
MARTQTDRVQAACVQHSSSSVDEDEVVPRSFPLGDGLIQEEMLVSGSSLVRTAGMARIPPPQRQVACVQGSCLSVGEDAAVRHSASFLGSSVQEEGLVSRPSSGITRTAAQANREDTVRVAEVVREDEVVPISSAPYASRGQDEAVADSGAAFRIPGVARNVPALANREDTVHSSAVYVRGDVVVAISYASYASPGQDDVVAGDCAPSRVPRLGKEVAVISSSPPFVPIHDKLVLGPSLVDPGMNRSKVPAQANREDIVTQLLTSREDGDVANSSLSVSDSYSSTAQEADEVVAISPSAIHIPCGEEDRVVGPTQSTVFIPIQQQLVSVPSSSGAGTTRTAVVSGTSEDIVARLSVPRQDKLVRHDSLSYGSPVRETDAVVTDSLELARSPGLVQEAVVPASSLQTDGPVRHVSVSSSGDLSRKKATGTGEEIVLCPLQGGEDKLVPSSSSPTREDEVVTGSPSSLQEAKDVTLAAAVRMQDEQHVVRHSSICPDTTRTGSLAIREETVRVAVAAGREDEVVRHDSLSCCSLVPETDELVAISCSSARIPILVQEDEVVSPTAVCLIGAGHGEDDVRVPTPLSDIPIHDKLAEHDRALRSSVDVGFGTRTREVEEEEMDIVPNTSSSGLPGYGHEEVVFGCRRRFETEEDVSGPDSLCTGKAGLDTRILSYSNVMPTTPGVPHSSRCSRHYQYEVVPSPNGASCGGIPIHAPQLVQAPSLPSASTSPTRACDERERVHLVAGLPARCLSLEDGVRQCDAARMDVCLSTQGTGEDVAGSNLDSTGKDGEFSTRIMIESHVCMPTQDTEEFVAGSKQLARPAMDADITRGKTGTHGLDLVPSVSSSLSGLVREEEDVPFSSGLHGQELGGGDVGNVFSSTPVPVSTQDDDVSKAGSGESRAYSPARKVFGTRTENPLLNEDGFAGPSAVAKRGVRMDEEASDSSCTSVLTRASGGIESLDAVQSASSPLRSIQEDVKTPGLSSVADSRISASLAMLGTVHDAPAGLVPAKVVDAPAGMFDRHLVSPTAASSSPMTGIPIRERASTLLMDEVVPGLPALPAVIGEEDVSPFRLLAGISATENVQTGGFPSRMHDRLEDALVKSSGGAGCHVSVQGAPVEIVRDTSRDPTSSVLVKEYGGDTDPGLPRVDSKDLVSPDPVVREDENPSPGDFEAGWEPDPDELEYDSEDDVIPAEGDFEAGWEP